MSSRRDRGGQVWRRGDRYYGRRGRDFQKDPPPKPCCNSKEELQKRDIELKNVSSQLTRAQLTIAGLR